MSRSTPADPTSWHAASETANGRTTTFPGVLQRDSGKRFLLRPQQFQKKGAERYGNDFIYRIRYSRKDGTRVDEVVGRSSEGWSASRACDKLLEFKANDAAGEGAPTSFAEEKALREAERRRLQSQGSVEQLFRGYVNWMSAAGRRTWRDVEHALLKSKDAPVHFLGATTKAKDVTPRDIMRYLRTIHERGRLSQAAHMRAYLSGAFNFGLKRENDYTRTEVDVVFGVEVNPVASVPADLSAGNVGTRYLSPEELRTVWDCIGEGDHRTQTVLAARLLVSTCGQRVREVLEADKTEFDLEAKLWSIPPERVKNGRRHVIPLSERSCALIRQAMDAAPGSRFLFPHRDNPDEPMHFRSLNRAFTRLSAAKEMERFTGRDLRRTARTLLSDAEIPAYLLDLFLNHGQSGVGQKHYDKSQHMAEKQRVLEAWDALLGRWLAPSL